MMICGPRQRPRQKVSQTRRGSLRSKWSCDPAFPRQPVSAEDRLRAATVEHLESLHLGESWYAKLPSHVGRSPAVDAAVRAFISSNRNLLDCKDASSDLCLRQYVCAIEHQRELATDSSRWLSDEALLSCALLGHFERTMGRGHSPPYNTMQQTTFQQTLMHLQAVQKMLLTRLNSFQTHELDYSIIYGHYILLVEAPLATGSPSPFERLSVPDPRAIATNPRLDAPSRLRRLAAELMLRAPRFVSDVRTCKANAMMDVETARLRERASALLDLRDDAAENELLHAVSITKSEPKTAGLTPYSFNFRTVADFDAGCNYWHARLLILRSSWILDIPARRTEICADGRRAAINLIMSWQHASGPLFMRVRFLHASCAVWGSITDFGVTVGSSLEQVQEYLLARAAETYRGAAGVITKERLDTTAHAYAGGPLCGQFIDMYRRHWRLVKQPER